MFREEIGEAIETVGVWIGVLSETDGALRKQKEASDANAKASSDLQKKVQGLKDAARKEREA